MPLIGNLLKALTKSVLISLGVTAAAETDAAIHKKNIISNEEMNDTMKILNSFEEYDLLTKGVSETIKNEIKEKNRWIS